MYSIARERLQSPHYFHLNLIGTLCLRDRFFLIDKNYSDINKLIIQIEVVPFIFSQK